MEEKDGDANRVKDEVLNRLKASLASPDDLAKVPAMLEDAERRHAGSGSALSEHIALHCAQLRTGLNDMAAALNETDAVKQRLKLILKLCRDSEVLSPGESNHAEGVATVQANIKRTIGGVENIYKFPARASDALAMLQEVDADHAALLDVFHDLSSLLSTLSVAEDLLADLRRQATLARIDDVSKVDAYFSRVQDVTEGFTAKLLSYFDDVIRSASDKPRHLVVALRVVLNQEATWRALHDQGAADKNPWGLLYRDEACGRMRKSVGRRMQPVCLEADRVFSLWMQRHGRTAPALFQEHAAAAAASSNPNSRRESGAGGAAGAVPPRPPSAGGGKAAAVLRNTSVVASRLIGGVGKAPIKLSSMPEAVNSEPEAVKWLKDIETDDSCADAMAATLERADEAVAVLVEVYDSVLPCFPPSFDPLSVFAKEFSEQASYVLDALGQAAPMLDNGSLLALLAWPDSYRRTLLGLGVGDDAMAVSTRPRVRTPLGDAVPLHGLDVARLVYIDRIRQQLASAFRNLADIDLLKEPEPDGRGRLWTPGVIELFRFLTQQVQLAAGVRDAEVVSNVAGVTLQIMQSYQDLVCSAMVERDLDFEALVAIVNNNLIAYDQSRDLAFTIDSALRPSDEPPTRLSSAQHTATFGPQGGEGHTESLVLPETAVHLDMEDACRGFLNVSKIALERAVDSIFAEEGVRGLGHALFVHKEWLSGVTTESFLLTLADYIGDLNEWLDPPFFKRAVQLCLKNTVKVFYTAFLEQMPSNRLRDAELERLEVDIHDIRAFFQKHISSDKVDQGMEHLDHMHSLVLCETADEFEERFGFMLMDSSCKVKPSEIAAVCAKRSDITAADAAAIEKECDRLYQTWLAEQSASLLSQGESEEDLGGRNLLANMYNRIRKAVGVVEE
eukprot:jgi/Ulvmu1/8111/UM040_0006.1